MLELQCVTEKMPDDILSFLNKNVKKSQLSDNCNIFHTLEIQIICDVEDEGDSVLYKGISRLPC